MKDRKWFTSVIGRQVHSRSEYAEGKKVKFIRGITVRAKV